MQHRKLATIEDVAAIAGVSIATVSRAINEPTKVAVETRRRVTEAVARTGYTTNAMARSLRMRRSNMILILAPDVGDPNFSNILVGLETEASKRGYGVLIGNTQNDPAREADYLRFISSNQADGLILFTGHLPFGFGTEEGQTRLPPMVAALAGAGLTVDPRLILDGDGTTESGRAAAEHMFVRDVLPTAFLCVNDATALGVIIALSARKYDLPRDFSVMGFDDISFASFVTPSLTTMKQPRLKIGEEAMDLLLALLAGETPSQNEVLLRAELIVRNSVSGPRRN